MRRRRRASTSQADVGDPVEELPRSKRVATLVRLAFVAIAQKAVQYSLNGLPTVGADSLGYGQLETATAWNIPAFP